VTGWQNVGDLLLGSSVYEHALYYRIKEDSVVMTFVSGRYADGKKKVWIFWLPREDLKRYHKKAEDRSIGVLEYWSDGQR
jgi:hypothetical protein